MKIKVAVLNSIIIKDFTENDSFNYRLNITSSFLEADKRGFRFGEFPGRKKVLVILKFLSKFKKDLKRKISIISLESQKKGKSNEIYLTTIYLLKIILPVSPNGNEYTGIIDFNF
jgi:hypothetical protein